MEATIQSNQMDVEKEEARLNLEVSNLPQERHIWRIPNLRPIPQRSVLTNFDVNSESGLIHDNILRAESLSRGIKIEIYQCQYINWFREAKEEDWRICPSLWQGAMNSYLHIKSFLGQEKHIELLGGWSPLSCKEKSKKIKNWLKNQRILSIDQKELEMTPALETEGLVASNSSKPAPEMSKDKPKGPQKNQKGPKNHQGKGKGKSNWHRPHPQGYRIPKLKPSAMDSFFNMARTLMEFIAKEEERMNQSFPWK
ncbi:hypothetical protein O181_058901 [Austropuccinia psidii MF-1]|uniref:Uncharacterized protein n=1 Tax=Austropuccinia psidii MF-1 TaxID=1389203 RepID=A0A9Q3EHZ7_9BASI|nr:hypothetical protein [Austropuccinia psidii MF-1]